ncbi:PadR family transcriptional regulator [Patulibacter sp. SYSU D01012]|uniref:PadR family transcriptional regulator n=1 Tax=Patulibacter sp. SYSU D01012 TaxID=2817381 RepID=UPI001B303EF2|nr:PadR family transcriptional regulator [Patulibacter sp. SYSU D01012]
MSLAHALLGLLADHPGTGYELRQRFEVSLRSAWYASHSQIYPELARLEARGLVEVVARGARGSKTWAVTDAGRDELRRWLVETEPNRDVRNEPGLRAFLVFLLDAADRRRVLQAELEEVRGRLASLDEIAARLDGLDRPATFAPVVDLGQRVDAVVEAWLREQLAAADEG